MTPEQAPSFIRPTATDPDVTLDLQTLGKMVELTPQILLSATPF
jgi:hypothetical protein